MPILVMKFGGTSVATLDRIRRAAKRIGREVANGYDVIVIVSAMAGKTNELVGWVEETSKFFDAREYDAVVSSGEQVTAGLLAMSGVLADHPRLHFVFVETNAGWLCWAMNTLDQYNEAFKHHLGWVRPVLPEPPSHYMKRQLHGTFQRDPVAIANASQTGIEPLLWGSDYPHHEGTYPHSRKVVQELCAPLAAGDAFAVVSGTAARLFHFDPEVVSTPP